MVSHQGTTADDRLTAQDQPVTRDQTTGQDRLTDQDEPTAQERFTTEERPTADDRLGTSEDREFATADREPDTADQEPVELSPVSTTAGDSPLFSPDDTENFQVEWRALQSEFVDDPREAVQRADELVAQVIQSLTDTFAAHKRSLDEQWRQGEQVQTEELRQALKRYRAFFDRLLSV
jgi:hypothetical protein